jgi:hypothetical protein
MKTPFGQPRNARQGSVGICHRLHTNGTLHFVLYDTAWIRGSTRPRSGRHSEALTTIKPLLTLCF